ncbi:potassium transporter KtrB [Candidatus Sumerlaeota bacterium]|nr:potassium transporter KtrB [Candidatus Sumerlaeota bacterium]
MKNTGVWNALKRAHPLKAVLWGYILYIFVGWLLLLLPFSRATSSSALDHLFTAASALSTTGLVTISVSDDYTFWGQLVVLLLIQMGGMGYMTITSCFFLFRHEQLDDHRAEIAKVVFALPQSFQLDRFLRGVIAFTAVAETLGAVALYFIFRKHGVADPLWSAIFHSISAFCTAGFSLYNGSFISMMHDPWLTIVLALISYTGGIGFIVCMDYWRKIRGEIEEVTLTSRIIVRSTLAIGAIGSFLLFIGEPSIQALPRDTRLLAAIFQAMTASTTVGFNTIPIDAVSHASALLLIVMMVIGASPSGTGGGVKTTTLSIVYATIMSNLRGRKRITFHRKPIPDERVRAAFANLGFYVFFLLTGFYLLALTEDASFQDMLFEAVSALGTVGLSMGLTSSLTDLGKIVIIVLMFAGRLGPMTMGIALFLRNPKASAAEDNDVVV